MMRLLAILALAAGCVWHATKPLQVAVVSMPTEPSRPLRGGPLTPPGGTITSVTPSSGGGLTGGGIAGAVQLGLLTSCSSGQVLAWNGSTWACASAMTGTLTNGDLSIATGTTSLGAYGGSSPSACSLGNVITAVTLAATGVLSPTCTAIGAAGGVTTTGGVSGEIAVFNNTTGIVGYSGLTSDSSGDVAIPGTLAVSGSATADGGERIIDTVSTGLTQTANSVAISNTAVTPGTYSYATVTVNQQGQLTSASSGTAPLTGTLTNGDLVIATGTSTAGAFAGSSPAACSAGSIMTDAALAASGALSITCTSLGTAGAVTSVTASAPITSSGGATPAIGISLASNLRNNGGSLDLAASIAIATSATVNGNTVPGDTASTSGDLTAWSGTNTLGNYGGSTPSACAAGKADTQPAFSAAGALTITCTTFVNAAGTGLSLSSSTLSLNINSGTTQTASAGQAFTSITAAGLVSSTQLIPASTSDLLIGNGAGAASAYGGSSGTACPANEATTNTTLSATGVVTNTCNTVASLGGVSGTGTSGQVAVFNSTTNITSYSGLLSDTSGDVTTANIIGTGTDFTFGSSSAGGSFASFVSPGSINLGSVPSGFGSAWTTFGPYANTGSSGGALALGYSTSGNIAAIIAIQPGLAWSTLDIAALAINLAPQGNTAEGLAQDSSGNDTVQGDLKVTGHFHGTGTGPTASSCGTSPTVTGSDLIFHLVVGSAASGACTLTWHTTYTTDAPVCSVDPTGTAAQPTWTPAVGSGTLGGTLTSSGGYDFICGAPN